MTPSPNPFLLTLFSTFSGRKPPTLSTSLKPFLIISAPCSLSCCCCCCAHACVCVCVCMSVCAHARACMCDVCSLFHRAKPEAWEHGFSFVHGAQNRVRTNLSNSSLTRKWKAQKTLIQARQIDLVQASPHSQVQVPLQTRVQIRTWNVISQIPLATCPGVHMRFFFPSSIVCNSIPFLSLWDLGVFSSSRVLVLQTSKQGSLLGSLLFTQVYSRSQLVSLVNETPWHCSKHGLCKI